MNIEQLQANKYNSSHKLWKMEIIFFEFFIAFTNALMRGLSSSCCRPRAMSFASSLSLNICLTAKIRLLEDSDSGKKEIWYEYEKRGNSKHSLLVEFFGARK